MTDAPDPLAALRAVYAKKLPDKMRELTVATQSLDGGDGGTASDLRDLAHKLAGSAPTFGFPELGDAARQIERLCDSVSNAGSMTDDDVADLTERVMALADQYGAGEATSEPREGGSAVTETPVALSGHVLVVEDEPAQAMFVDILLKKAGLDVTVVNDPFKVAETLSSCQPKLVLLDMNMPGMNGDDVAKLIRARDDALAGVPILFLSGEENPDRRAAAMAAGGNGFIDKPVRPDTLTDTLKPYL